MLKNLAGVANCDEHIEYELNRARIPAIVANMNRPRAEVSYTLVGQLSGFTFVRYWTYWAVNGAIPLGVAEELYADPVGATDIRVAGHASCPPPGDWAEWLVPSASEDPASPESLALMTFLQSANLPAGIHPVGWYVIPPEYSKRLGAKQYVTEYHVDSEVGLRVLVDILRAHNLVAEPVAV